MPSYKTLSRLLTLAAFAICAFAQASVTVLSPTPVTTVGRSVQFVATATAPTCARGVASMGIYVDNKLVFVGLGSTLNTVILLNPGTPAVVVQEWDNCGGATVAPVALTVKDGGIIVTSPTPNSVVDQQVAYTATATSSCATGVAAMGVYVNNNLLYVTNGAKLDTILTLAVGIQSTVVQEWDNCGASATVPVKLTVQAHTSSFRNLQATAGWKSSGQLAPYFLDCETWCGTSVTGGMFGSISSPSLSGSATRFDLGGVTPYSDMLFYKQLIGTASTQGLPDLDRTLIAKLNNFVYNADFLVPDPDHTQATEFDINMFPGSSVGMTWGTECRLAGGHEWDIWDNVQGKWIDTGYACTLKPGWNHVTVAVQRGPNNTLIYQSITLNGTVLALNKTYAPFTVPSDWYGVTVNYQMDGDSRQTPISTYLDNFTLTYW